MESWLSVCCAAELFCWLCHSGWLHAAAQRSRCSTEALCGHVVPSLQCLLEVALCCMCAVDIASTCPVLAGVCSCCASAIQVVFMHGPSEWRALTPCMVCCSFRLVTRLCTMQLAAAAWRWCRRSWQQELTLRGCTPCGAVLESWMNHGPMVCLWQRDPSISRPLCRGDLGFDMFTYDGAAVHAKNRVSGAPMHMHRCWQCKLQLFGRSLLHLGSCTSSYSFTYAATRTPGRSSFNCVGGTASLQACPALVAYSLMCCVVGLPLLGQGHGGSRR